MNCSDNKFLCLSPTAILVASLILLSIESASAQELVLYYDFEGDTALNIEDVSGNGTPANGLIAGIDASIVADSVDPNSRGDVLSTGASGRGATVPHARKMDFNNSFTLQAWYMTNDPLQGIPDLFGNRGVFDQIAGIGGSGPRIFNHWGLGSLGAVQLLDASPDDPNAPPTFDGFDPIEIVEPIGTLQTGVWHHIVFTFNAATQQIWGYYDGFDGGDPNDENLSPKNREGTHTVIHTDAPFEIGGVTGQSGAALPNAFIDDVAFWQGYADPNVVAGLFSGSLSVHDATSLMQLPTKTGDFVQDDGFQTNVVNGLDFLRWQQNAGLDDTSSALAVRFFDGDGNGDLKVDSKDLAIWEEQYGGSPPDGARLATVPEPASVLLMTGGLVAFMLRKTRK